MGYIQNNYDTDSVLKSVFVMKYSPKILHKQIDKRMLSSFLYVICGNYHYKYTQGDIYVKSGDTIYLPKGGCYTYEVLSQETQVIQVEFDLEECSPLHTKSVTFAENPTLIYGYSRELCGLFEQLFDAYYEDKITSLSLVYRLMCICKDSLGTQKKSVGEFAKIASAVQYIEKNFQNKIYIEELAQIAGVSQSHLRRLFQKCLGVSPVKYKNKILMKAACNMLLNEGLNVSETADALQFSDIYTFSQLFKKEIGVSPKKYIEENK